VVAFPQPAVEYPSLVAASHIMVADTGDRQPFGRIRQVVAYTDHFAGNSELRYRALAQ
jgi:hypothetical protein